MSIKEQYFNTHFNAHRNDFSLNNGNYEANLYPREIGTEKVHDDVNDGK